MSKIEKTGIKEVEEAFAKVYLMADPYIVKLMMAFIISHDLPLDPLWAFIIAKSGAGKTEMVNTLLKLPNILAISSLTPSTLISGAQTGSAKEASLLVQAGSPVVIVKDFTVIMSMPHEQQSEIYGQFRDMYDGKMDKAFGTGNQVNWEGKVTMLAAATHAAHEMREKHGHLGERFLLYEMLIPNDTKVAKVAMLNQESGEMSNHRIRLQEIMSKWRNSIKLPKKLPVITDKFKDTLIKLAILTTRARTSVRRDWRSANKDIISPPEPEVPTRFASQLQAAAQALLIINKSEGQKGLQPLDREMLYKLTLDSMPKNKRITLQKLAQYSQIETKGLALSMGMPTNTVHRWLEDLSTVKLVDRIETTTADAWALKPKYRKLLQKFTHVEDLDIELTENSAHLSDEELKAVKNDAKSEGISEDEINSIFSDAPIDKTEII